MEIFVGLPRILLALFAVVTAWAVELGIVSTRAMPMCMILRKFTFDWAG